MSLRSRTRLGVSLLSLALLSHAQTATNEREFPQSKAAVEKAVSMMQQQLSGHLPILEGFATPGQYPLNRCKRGYYQATVQVRSSASGGALVRVTTKVTAWYDAPSTSRSGYQLLTSNGRLEADLLDQLAEQLAKANDSKSTVAQASPSPAGSQPADAKPAINQPAIDRPAPTFAESARNFTLGRGLPSAPPKPPEPDKPDKALQSEARNLEDILKNQAHPKNLVAVKASGTPVVPSPSLNAKPLFLASVHDEFEMLDFTQDWVHVRISGLSRGWIWRDSLEMPDAVPDTASASVAPAPARTLFHIASEQVAQFPGDWEPLRGKQVSIISVQKSDNSSDAGPQDRLDYAKLLLQQESAHLTAPGDPAGIVLIFDSADGGMIAATAPAIQQWRTGSLSDPDFWRESLLDPSDAFNSRPPSASR